MNKKGQIGEIIGLFVEFIVIFYLVGALGAAVFPMTYDVPLGALFRVILPSPESVGMDFIKRFIWAILGTGGTAYALFK